MPRQVADSVTVLVFRTLHRRLDINTTPRVTAAEALARLERQEGAGPATSDPPTSGFCRHLRGEYVLAWRATLNDRRTYFLDAHRAASSETRRAAVVRQSAGDLFGFGSPTHRAVDQALRAV